MEHSMGHGMGRRECGCRGFTLVEVMIVLVVIAVLLMVALPGYQQQLLKTRRSVALSTLETLRTRQEQFFVNNRRYATDLTALGYASSPFAIDEGGEAVDTTSAGRIYTVSITGASTSAFTLRAAAQLGQAGDSNCLTLTLAHTGERGASPGSARDCW